VDIKALALDANILVPAMLGGRTRDLIVRLALAQVELQSPEDAWVEVEDRIADLAGYTRARIDAFRLALASIPVRRVARSDYAASMDRARKLIEARDAEDVPIVALALAKNLPVWSNDKDLKTLQEIRVYTTRELAVRLAS
jgi:predicted nucleic acid-binding protein